MSRRVLVALLVLQSLVALSQSIRNFHARPADGVTIDRAGAIDTTCEVVRDAPSAQLAIEGSL